MNVTALLCGNPNVGKSTVFNALTGLRQHTGNWAGKTVETAQGSFRTGEADVTLIDLPGMYSLTGGSQEERIAAQALCKADFDCAVVVLDATCLSRSLALALQVMQAAPRVVLCLNLMDEALHRGVKLDVARLREALGVPVIPTAARGGDGLDALKQAIVITAQKPPQIHGHLLTREETAALPPCPGGNCARPLCTWLGVDAQEGEALFRPELTEAAFRAAERITRQVTASKENQASAHRRLRLDRLLTSRYLGFPLMLALLALVFAITLWLANMPSAWLSKVLFGFQDTLRSWLSGAPTWLQGLLCDGVWRTLAWVVSVMLPPMAIFFPLFTLLEDLGYLPRVAFNVDRLFSRCDACGKQALCMMQGLGCNAVGVMGARIIDSPRERLIAMLTNAMIPCNGRFPTMITLIGLFLVTAGGFWGGLLSAGALMGVILLGVAITLLSSLLLSKTVLRGVPSMFTLELPPFRRPQIGRVIVRSVLDRTLYVLGRAVCVAAPAGLALWLLGNIQWGGETLLTHFTAWLQPVGAWLGMDGVLLAAFILAFPANEIVLPVALMGYLGAGSLVDGEGLEMVRTLLVQNGWTAQTAVCVLVFSLLHWPCSTTLLTLHRETHSLKWTLLAAVLPTAFGALLCHLISIL